MSNFNWVDIVFLIIFLLSIIAGFGRGFVREIVSLITLIAAIAIAIIFSNSLANYLINIPSVSTLVTQASSSSSGGTTSPVTYVALGVSFALIFIGVSLVGAIIGYILNAIFQFGVLGIGNRILGGLFGLIRGYFINLVIIFVIQLTAFADQTGWKESKIVAYYQPAVLMLANIVSPSLANLKAKFQKTVQNVNSQFETITSVYQ